MTKQELISFGDIIRKRIPPLKISALITGVKKPEVNAAEKTIDTPQSSHPRNVEVIRSKKKKRFRN